MMQRTGQGRLILLLVAVGAFFNYIAPQIRAFDSWADALKPAFVADLLPQFALLIGAWVAGQVSPGGTIARGTQSVLEKTTEAVKTMTGTGK